MPEQQQNHTVWTAYLSATAGTVPVGRVLCLNAAGTRYVIATTANLALQTLGPIGIANSAGDEDNLAVELQFCGLIPESVTGLGEGDAGPVGVSATGTLERWTTGGIVGSCDALGNALVFFVGGAVVSITSNLSVAGTGFVHATSGVIDPAATALARYASGKVQIDGNLQFRNTGDSNRTLDLVATPTSTNKTLTLPNATDQVVARDTTDTLTNKTLTSPIVNGVPVYRSGGVDIESIVGRTTTAATTPVALATRTPAAQDTEIVSIIVRSRRDGSNTKRGSWAFKATVSRNGGDAVLDDLKTETAFNLDAGTVAVAVSGTGLTVTATPADTDSRIWDYELRVHGDT